MASKISKSRSNCEEIYATACALHGLYPIKSVKEYLDNGILDINADKVSELDWKPVCRTLKSANDFQFIAVRSFRERNKVPDEVSRRGKRFPLQKLDIRCDLYKSIGSALISNGNGLKCLELQNIPITLQDIRHLAHALQQNKSIAHLSLQQCSIGDAGLQVLGKVLRNAFQVSSINLSGCNISWRGIQILLTVIKYQTVCRHSNAWQETLRERVADLDEMGGLQRITLNQNANIGDKGAKLLGEIIKEDLWLKAVDIQSCNIKDGGAASLLQSLKQNSTLYILDVRRNVIRDRNLLVRIGQQLNFNTQGKTSQFKWLVSNSKFPVTKKSGGIPWRVSTRLSSLRHLPSYVPGIANVFLRSNPNLFDYTVEETGNRVPKRNVNPKMSIKQANLIKDITTQLDELKILFQKERDCCKAAEKRIEELTSENEKLKLELRSDSAVVDSSTLEAIELAFTKMNDFISML